MPDIVSDNNVELRLLNQKQAYKRPIGTNNDPINNAGIRISGVPTPPFLSASYIKTEEKQFKKSHQFCLKADAYMFVYLIGKFGSKYEGKNEADTHPNISNTSYSRAEMICLVENVLGRKGINREAEKDGLELGHTGKGGEHEVEYTCSFKMEQLATKRAGFSALTKYTTSMMISVSMENRTTL